MTEKLTITKTKSQELPQIQGRPSLENPVSIVSSPTRSRLKSEAVVKSSEFQSRALSFLKSISTGSPNLTRGLSAPDQLSLIPSSQIKVPIQPIAPGEILEINQIQAWVVSSGSIKKSYMHCIRPLESFPYQLNSLINLNNYPDKFISSSIKSQMNADFANDYPLIDCKLSMIINLREKLVEYLCNDIDIDPAIVAAAICYFERLLNLNLINKSNRKLYAVACVLLSFKFFEETHLDETKFKLISLLKKLKFISKNDLTSESNIFLAEFSVYSYLKFSLHLTPEEISENFAYVLSKLNDLN